MAAQTTDANARVLVEEAAAESEPGEAVVTVLVVGQTPPPVNGQTLMIQAFLQGQYERLRLVYVPMHFSRSSAELGRFSARKSLLLLSTLYAIVLARFRSGASVLYYPPASPNLAPVLRDMVLLIATRWLFRSTAFHFHAAGLCEIYSRLPRLLRPLFHLAYDHPDLAIFTTLATSAEAAQLRARATAIIPCGIEDRAAEPPPAVPAKSTTPSILFAGILCEGKGVLDLVEACGLLQKDGVAFQAVCLGQFQSEEFRLKVEAALDRFGLRSQVLFPGVVMGEQKDSFFRNAAVFCFPSYYAAESFGVVLIEAMSFSLPIVATAWRGIPEVLGRAQGDSRVKLDGSRLVPVCDPASLAISLRELLESPQERQHLGAYNRARYLRLFTIDRYRKSLEEHLVLLTQAPGSSSHCSMVSSAPQVEAGCSPALISHE